MTFDLLTSKLVSESRVTWATSMPILVFIGLSVLELGPMYATDRRQTKASLNASVLCFYRATLCVSAVFAVLWCLSVRHVGVLYPHGQSWINYF